MNVRTVAAALAGCLAVTALVGGPSANASADDQSISWSKLKTNAPRHLQSPPEEGHHWKYATKSPSWSVVTARGHGLMNPNLLLYSDKEMTDELGTSKGSGIEFVAVDSTQRPLDDYYAKVWAVQSGYPYDIEQAQSSEVLGAGAIQVKMTKDDPIAVRDTVLVAGQSYRFLLIPIDGKELSGGLYLMGSDPNAPATWVRSKAQSLAYDTASGAQPAIFDFVAPRTDRYGLVITKYDEEQSGGFLLQRLPL